MSFLAFWEQLYDDGAFKTEKRQVAVIAEDTGILKRWNRFDVGDEAARKGRELKFPLFFTISPLWHSFR